ncbi:MAG: Putative organic solvent tolerance protein OstA [uncultured Aureispira sp.]|uniref:Organic solvent tolerance protein OstA n=1 Tax=uncultured Aureispira sp. TaxID=1331704 RepID=A0A6S6UG03_9BACT|nr:MAG: Putative organic solvent tolerance protein OstA [uncultured Aureispira sp.]
MVLLIQKYYKLLCFLTICSLFCSSCGFPYNTRQARDARKAQRLDQKQAKKLKGQASNDTTTVASKDTTLVVSKNVKGSKFNKLDPNSSTLTIDSNSVSPKDSLSVVNIPLTPADTLNIDTLMNPDLDSLDTLDSTLLGTLDTTITALDSMLLDSMSIDSMLSDSMRLDSIPEVVEGGIRYSQDSVDMPVQYESADSMIYDLVERKVYMYDNAEVFYEQYNLKAGYIEFNFLTNVATATCLIDSAGNEEQCPFFDDKTQQFTCRRIEFNFKTKKGKIYDATTQQGDGYLVSNATKFISAGGDSTTDNSQNILYSQGCLYTTCDAEHPHFGIRASKAKIIPGKLIVVGPSFLEIMGSPTPILLPFGFFPITKNKRSGLILSMDLDFSTRLGPGIQEIGFYLGLSEYWDLKVTGDFYMRGSFRTRVASNYNIRYKGQGKIELGYNRLQIDDKNTPGYSLSNDFKINWTHSQSPQAHPSQNFTGTINFGTSNYNKNTFNDVDNVLATTFNSNISYTKRFLGTPFSLSARISHSQNTNTNAMTITFPQLSFNMNQIFPFKRKNISGSKRWYDRIGFSYNMNGNNTITTTDTALFQPGGLEKALEDMNYSLTHNPRLNFSFKLFKVINVQPSVNYTQQWFFYRNKQFLDPTPTVSATDATDTTSFGSIENYKEYGFYTTHSFRAGVNVTTQIYATGQFNLGPLKSLRAVFTPNVGLSWSPDYENAYDYFYDSVQYDTRYPEVLRRYNYFSFSPPSGRTALLTYSLSSIFEAKVKKTRRDSLNKEPFKKVILIPRAAISGSYNIAADSLHLAPISFNTSTTLFKKINVQFSSTFDPYAANPETNARINTFEYSLSKRLARVTAMSFLASTSLSSKDLRKVFGKKDAKEDEKDKDQFDLIQKINIGYNLVINNKYINGVDTSVVIANQLSLSGAINLSKGWSIRIGNIGYSFKDERITFPDFTFARDLHCWQMGLSWQPERQTWNFYIRVKPGSLGFLEVPVQRGVYDTF